MNLCQIHRTCLAVCAFLSSFWLAQCVAIPTTLSDDGGPDGSPRDGPYIGLLVDCLINANCPPAPGGGGGGGPTTTDNTFFLHGSIVDQLDRDANGIPRLMLQYNRARYYDLKNARWLQRDPAAYGDGSNLYEAFADNPLVNADPRGRDSIETDGAGDLIYTKPSGFWGGDGFSWRFARQVSAALPDLMVIDHEAWPYAFLMTRQNAMSEFNTWAWRDDYTYHGQFLQRAAYLTLYDRTKVVALLDKRMGSAAWVVPGEALDMMETHAANRTEELSRFAHAGLAQEVAGAANLTAVSFTVTTGALAAPAGVGGMIVDAAATAADVAGGRFSAATGGLVVTALVAGTALHLRVADDALSGVRLGG